MVWTITAIGCLAWSVTCLAIANATHRFDLVAQELGNALKSLCAVADEQVLFSETTVSGLRSSEVKGEYTTEAALSILLQGTGLHADRTPSGVLLIRGGRHSNALYNEPRHLPMSDPEGPVAGNRLHFAQSSPQGIPAGGGGGAERADVPRTGLVNDTPNPVEEVVVTGTHLVTNGNAQPTPVTVISTNDLLAASPKGMAEGLVELPSFIGSNSRTVGGAAANAGHTYLNLRGLGVQRNLVLLDGRRFVPTSDGGAPDINLFPQLLVKRVEVVTGGASAAYGSDAVAGVTNFVLDNEFTGLKALASGAVTSYGDDATYRASIAGGKSFFEGRLHLVASADITHSDGVAGYVIGGPDRPWQKEGRFLMSNPAVGPGHPASPSNPSLIPGKDVRFPYASYGGVISSGPLAGIQFLPGGVSAPFNYGANRSSGYMEGGDGATSAGGANLETPLNAKVFFTHASYKLSDDLSAYAEGLFGQTDVYMKAGPSYGYNSTAYTIYRDNAFLPADIAEKMDKLTATSFPLGRWNLDLGIYKKTVQSKTWRGVLGFEGRFGDGWTWDVYYQHGQNRGRFVGENGMIPANLYNAVDAVRDPATGQPVCNSTLTNPGNGCVPINLFGAGSPSAAAIAYVMGEPYALQTVKEDVAAAGIHGQPLSSWAGPIQLAAGFEHRREGVNQVVDSLSTIRVTGNGIRGFPRSLIGTQGGYFLGNSNPVDGAYDVNEVYAETGVPLASGLPWAQSLDLNAALRLTKYSSVGRVNTWKVGLSYLPVNDLRLRGTVSHDVRAPNVGELYLSQAQTIQTVLDSAHNNSSATATIILPGNPNLVAEESNTVTYGLVFQPRWASGFSTAIDVFHIKILHAIGRLSSQQTVDQCVQGNAFLCGLITRTDNGSISIVTTPNLNLAQMTENGIDLESNYNTDISDWHHSLAGNLTVRALATYVSKLASTTQGSPTIDRAGSTPFRLNLSATYGIGGFEAFVLERMIGRRAIDTTYTASTLANNNIGQIWYTDLTLSYRPRFTSGDYQIFATINNLFNRDPPTGILPGSTQGTPTISDPYDAIGRFYTLGVRLRF
jgi:outer membrane receptor protein involved in Fe transport